MIDYGKLTNAARLLMQAALWPIQGDRFQSTGFADLGPARYVAPNRNQDGSDGWIEMLLVESAQSVANRMELACCQDDKRTLLAQLKGLPFVQSKHAGRILTTSYLEAHRLSSPYLLNDAWAARLAGDLELRDDFPLNDAKIFTTFFKFDPCSLLHGVWLSLEKYKTIFSGGRVRIARALSGFIEAKNARVAENGGTKFDRNAARTEENANAKSGYGTLPFHRTEFTAEEITAYFNLDLALLRGYRLDDDARKLLIALALLKIRRFLSTGLRLRSACDLELKRELVVKKPDNFSVPSEEALLTECESLIGKCREQSLFAVPPVTEIDWQPPNAGVVKVSLPRGTEEPTIPDALKDQLKWKQGTARKGPTLEFTKGLTQTIAESVTGLFPGNDQVARAIAEKLKSQSVDAATEESAKPAGASEDDQ